MFFRFWATIELLIHLRPSKNTKTFLWKEILSKGRRLEAFNFALKALKPLESTTVFSMFFWFFPCSFGCSLFVLGVKRFEALPKRHGGHHGACHVAAGGKRLWGWAGCAGGRAKQSKTGEKQVKNNINTPAKHSKTSMLPPRSITFIVHLSTTIRSKQQLAWLAKALHHKNDSRSLNQIYHRSEVLEAPNQPQAPVGFWDPLGLSADGFWDQTWLKKTVSSPHWLTMNFATKG